MFDWWIRWEECDAGCDDLKKQSAISWGEYVDYDYDTSFANGYQSFLDVLIQGLKGKVSIRKVCIKIGPLLVKWLHASVTLCL